MQAVTAGGERINCCCLECLQPAAAVQGRGSAGAAGYGGGGVACLVVGGGAAVGLVVGEEAQTMREKEETKTRGFVSARKMRDLPCNPNSPFIRVNPLARPN